MRARLAGLAVAVLAVAATVAGCSMLPARTGVVPASSMTLNVSNGTTLPVALAVNGIVVDQIGPQDARSDIPASKLPPLPWSVEVRSPSGRVLVSVVVHGGDVASFSETGGGSGERGVAQRVDLSCGRIDVWSGPPLSGPSTGPGVPGDCAP